MKYSFAVRGCLAGACLLVASCGGSKSNEPPQITGTSLSGVEDQDIVGRIVASDPEGQPLTYSLRRGPAAGVATVGADGALTYRPNPDTHGVDSFDVGVSDPKGKTASTTVNVTITAVNDAPRIAQLARSINEDVVLVVSAPASDPEGGAITATRIAEPSHGTITAFGADGGFTYAPVTNYHGPDTFVVRFSDAQGLATDATFAITVASVNDAPLATADQIRVAMSPTIQVNVLTNDSDGDGDPLIVTLVEQPLLGAASVNANQTISITGLPAGFNGFTRLRYRVSDAAGATSDAYAAIFVDTAPFGVVTVRQVGGHPQIELTGLVGDSRLLNPGETASGGPAGLAVASEGGVVAWTYSKSSVGGQAARVCVARLMPAAASRCVDAPGDVVGHMELSPDGRWLAYRADILDSMSMVIDRAFVLLDTTDLSSLPAAPVPGAPYVMQYEFSRDSRRLYFLAAESFDATGLSLHRRELGGTIAVTKLSGPDDPASRIARFEVANDQSRVVFSRAGASNGLMLVVTASPGTEHRISPADPGIGMAAPAFTANSSATRVAYVVSPSFHVWDIYTADVAASGSNPHVIATHSGESVSAMQIRDDGNAVLYRYYVQGPTTELNFFANAEAFESGPVRTIPGESSSCYGPDGYIWASELAFTPSRVVGANLLDPLGINHQLSALMKPRSFADTCGPSRIFAYSEHTSPVPAPADPDGVVRFRTMVGNVAEPDSTLELQALVDGVPSPLVSRIELAVY